MLKYMCMRYSKFYLLIFILFIFTYFNFVSADTTIALGETIEVEGSGVNLLESNVIEIYASGTYEIIGNLGDGMININADEGVILNLNNANITNNDGPVIFNESVFDLNINLLSGTTNTLNDGAIYNEILDPLANATIYSNGIIEIEGEGSLIVNGNKKHGIYSLLDITVNSGDIEINTLNELIDGDGIHAERDITINGGTFEINGNGIEGDGIDSKNDLLITNGDINIAVKNDSIKAKNNLVIENGTININGSYEGIESKNGYIHINGGYITIETEDDGLNASTNVTISGGNVYVNSEIGDGLDSNGTINISGGTILLTGYGTSDSPESGIDCGGGLNFDGECPTNFSITGGTLLATGGNNSIPTSRTSIQNSVVLSAIDINSILRIEQDLENILTYKISKVYRRMLFSSPLIKLNNEYIIYKDGDIEEGTEFHGLYTDSDYDYGKRTKAYTQTSKINTILNINTVTQSDLVTSSPTPTEAKAETAKVFSATITNNGIAPTDRDFVNLFQTNTSPEVNESITNHETSLAEELQSGESTTTSVSITFPSSGKYYMRVCADRNKENKNGNINESNKENNCSEWVSISVSRKSSSGGSGGGSYTPKEITSTEISKNIETNFVLNEIQNTNTLPVFTINYIRLIKQGLRGEDVKQLQYYLSSKGYNLGIIDGIFGIKTKQAVILFQLANGLKGDGVVGPLTISKIN